MDQQIAAAVAKVYEAVLEPAKWDDALLLLGRCIDGYGGQFMLWDDEVRTSAFSVITGAAEEANDLYTSYYAAIDPRLAYAMKTRLPAGEWVLCHHICNDREVSRSEFYQDFLIPTGTRYMTGTRLFDDAGQHAMICLGRHVGDKPFTETDDRLLSSITPHLQLAARMQLKLWHLQQAESFHSAVMDRLDFVVFVLDATGRIHYLNVRAREALRTWGIGGPLRISSARLVACDGATQQHLRRAVASATGGGCVGDSFRMSRGLEAWSCVTVPIRADAALNDAMQVPLAMVLVFDVSRKADVPVAVLASVFGLTPAEARVACSMANGCSVKECAAEQGVSVATIKSQLIAVYAKMAVRRQSELAAIVHRLGSIRLHADGVPASGTGNA